MTSRPIVVLAQNLRLYHISPYLEIARAHGYQAEVVTFVVTPQRLVEKGAPKMLAAYDVGMFCQQILPAAWGVEEIFVYEEEAGFYANEMRRAG